MGDTRKGYSYDPRDREGESVQSLRFRFDAYLVKLESRTARFAETPACDVLAKLESEV